MNPSSRGRTLALALFTFAAFACSGSSDDQVEAFLEEVSTARSALPIAKVSALYGVYGAGCAGRTAGEAWAVGIDGATGLAHPALTVRKNDADCVLSLTGVVTPAGEYAGAGGHALDAAFAPSPAVFSSAAADPSQILVNAKMSSLSFAADFGISVSVSVVPSTASASMVATRAVTYEWTTGSWMGCDTTCGVGTDTRAVSCIDMTTTLPAPDAKCVAHERPASTQSCEDYSHCSAPDVTGPSLVSSTPAASATGVSADVVLTATFDEPLAAASSFTLKRGASAVAGTTSVNGNTITFTPSPALRLTVTTYTVGINAVDAAGNATVTSFTFTTRDAAPPVLSNMYPSNGETGIPRLVNLVASAGENLAPQSSVTLTKVSDGTTISGTTTIEGMTIVFDPTIVLQSFTVYKGVFTAFDAAGNKTTEVVQFTTGSNSY